MRIRWTYASPNSTLYLNVSYNIASRLGVARIIEQIDCTTAALSLDSVVII